jgi:hypothetical protein
MCGAGHDAPLTVLADDAFPVLADPVESAEELLEVADGVLDVVVDADAIDVDAALTDDVPGCVSAASPASAATATVLVAASDRVSLPRRRRARSRSATVMRRFGAAITTTPAAAPTAVASRVQAAMVRAASEPRRAHR